MTKFKKHLEDFKKAVERLEEVLKLEKTDITRDSAIKRFEMAVDTGWKALKNYLEDRYGVVCRSPKVCFREAYQQGLIDYDEYWLRMIDLRNKSVHTYEEMIAEEVYAELPKALNYLKSLLSLLTK